MTILTGDNALHFNILQKRIYELFWENLTLTNSSDPKKQAHRLTQVLKIAHNNV